VKRLLGYVVKLPSGEWHDGKSYADKDFDGYPWTKDAKKRRVFAEYQDACRYVLTYVPENRLRIVPVYSRPKPAPADGAAEGRYAVLVQYDDREPTTFMDLNMSVPDARPRDVGTHAEVLAAVENETPAFRRMAVRILPDGAHEAACEAARREERERVLAEVEAYAARAAKRIAQADPHSWAGGRSGAFAEIAEAVRTMGEEKGQAK